MKLVSVRDLLVGAMLRTQNQNLERRRSRHLEGRTNAEFIAGAGRSGCQLRGLPTGIFVWNPHHPGNAVVFTRA
jgi:transposase